MGEQVAAALLPSAETQKYMHLENCISRERHQISKAKRTEEVCQVKKPFQRKSFKGSRETWKMASGNAMPGVRRNQAKKSTGRMPWH